MSKTLNKYSRNVGNFLMITGILHLITGFVENWDAAIEILHAGIVNTVDHTTGRLTFFWFEISGLVVLLLGSIIQQYLDEYRKPIPKKHGYYLLTFGVIGCLLQPVSGFYVFVLIALPIIFHGHKNFIADRTEKSEIK